MTHLYSLNNVFERDIDILIADELCTNHDSAIWLASRAWPEIKGNINIDSLSHSVSDDLGESDLVIIYCEPSSDSKRAILLENKISAEPQPNQADRYRQRGQRGIATSHWQSFRTVMIAPADYLNSVQDAMNYDCRISYEDFLAWLLANGRAFKAHAVYVALRGRHRKSTIPFDESVTIFFEKYGDHVNQHFPEIRISRPKHKRTGNSLWAYFKPAGKPKDFDLLHKVDRGCVEISIPTRSVTAEKIRMALEIVDTDDVVFVPRDNSSALQVFVPELTFPCKFDPDLPAIANGIVAVQKLTLICRQLAHNLGS